MCGFVGFVKNSDTKNFDKSVILNMNRSLLIGGQIMKIISKQKI